MGQRELPFLYSGSLAGNSLFLVITPEKYTSLTYSFFAGVS